MDQRSASSPAPSSPAPSSPAPSAPAASSPAWEALRRRTRHAGLAALVLLGGCAEAELAGHIAAMNAPEGRPTYHVGAPYERGGQRVVPAERFVHEETGIAAWYGPGLHGRRTANGEIFDMNALSAAHPSLQLPAIALVTNLENGRTVRLRINDRGPASGDRILDVSRQAAELLGFRQQGVARVRLRVLPEESLALRLDLTGRPAAVVEAAADRQAPTAPTAPMRPAPADAVAAGGPGGAAVAGPGGRLAPPAAPPAAAAVSAVPGGASRLWIEAATFRDRGAAEAVRNRADALAPARLEMVRIDGTDYWRLRLGPFADRPAAQSALSRAWRAGLPDARLASP